MPSHQPSDPRSRRVDDALSRLVDSLLPPRSDAYTGSSGTGSNPDEAQRAEAVQADERRHHRALENAWRIIETYGNGSFSEANSNTAAIPPETINNAPDLIKRKLLKQHSTPDKAVRFSNLYSRLLTQPVLGQKWAILYLLYRIGDHAVDEDEPAIDRLRGGARSPLLEEHHLDSMATKFARKPDFAESIAPESSASAFVRENTPSELHRSGSQRGKRDPTSSARPPKERRKKTEEPAKQSGSANRSMEDFIPADKKENIPESTENTADVAMKPSEPELLRDMPFFLQGLSTTNLEFTSQSAVKLPTTLPIPLISLLHTLAEPSLLYRGLSKFVEGLDGGLIEQSLRAAIGLELRSYLGLVASLEGEIRTALTAVSQNSSNPQEVMKTGVSLKRCVIWMKDATLALRLMSVMVAETQNKRGGQLISMVHAFSTNHGDPFVQSYAEKLLALVTKPFYNMLRQWIYDGELSDPYNEFFVTQPEIRLDIDPRRTATSVWDEKYKLDDEMIPTILTRDFAKKVFLIGKSLNFIRYGCGDSSWVVAYSREASKELRYGDTAALENYVDEAYKTTMDRLIYLMDTKFKFFDHLNALKKYLLLGQGDFIALLMENLSSNLDRPANSQYRHTLTAQLEHAIRASNAQYDSPDVLRRLDARMLELSHGEIGWDCFTLEYKIDAPVDVIITPWASTQYLKVFNFLWRVKRVEFALGSTWRRCMTGARSVLGGVEDKVGRDWKEARCVIAEMIHFVRQLQYYILFEVIEASWDQLQVAISRPGCTLDDLIDAHTKYLNSITHKGLLGSSSSSSRSSGTSKEDSFLAQLHQILKIMLSYKDAVDGLYSFSVAEFTRRQEFNAKIETRTAQGRWGVTEKDLQQQALHTNRPSRSGSTRRHPSAPTPIDSPFLSGADDPKMAWGADTPGTPFFSRSALTAEDHLLPSLRSRLRDLSVEFRARLVTLLSDLAYQPDVDMRFLGVVMNFNEVYQLVRRRRGHGASISRDKRKAAAGGASAEGAVEKDKERVSRS
ncbi:Microtubule-nucleating Tub4p (gamma-tubulin) complex component [Myotisia sp. PD_48]|nr:Microtubule-nucleating Tub4p (gamma-tubulin) complex component [Myotisia sp. PD_48]